ncbi:glutamate receptor ionotropic, delta-1-like [Periplaneta americana]|uniref:glutamate receptor ionotropic, delta-1-like n=1 Tax=Periplaneta americana TaxID=6978 RepID=UPI0037E9930F
MQVSGYIGELWAILERTLQFKSVMRRAGFEEGLSLLKSGEADAMLQPVVVTGNNIGDYDFTRPVASSWYELYVRAPEGQASAQSHFTVWGPNVWMATLATTALLTVAVRLMCKCGAFEEDGGTRRRQRVTLSLCFLSVLGSLGSEGFQLRPSSVSGRVLMVTTLLFGLLLYNSYSAVLVASLAVTNPTLPFNDLDDVAKKGTHALCVRNLSYAYMRLKESEAAKEVAPQWREVVARKPCGNAVTKRDLEAVLCRWGVAVLETPSNMAVTKESACHMKQIRGHYFAVPVSLEFRANLPYTHLINFYINRLQTSGILQYLRSKWVVRTSLVSEEEAVPHTTVTLRHVELVLSLYAASIAYSVAVLMLEIAWNKRTQAARTHTLH